MLTETVICQKTYAEAAVMPSAFKTLFSSAYFAHNCLGYVPFMHMKKDMKKDRHVTTDSKANHLTKPLEYKST